MPTVSTLPRTESPWIGLGMLSIVLGMIALLLFFLPILGIPISAAGLLCGIAGAVLANTIPHTRLRWSLAGIATCGLALGINFALIYAPGGYVPARPVPPPWQPVPDTPYVSPPARPD